MKAVILAGGLGTRLSEETHLKPKPMVEIGSKPILWHIMKIFSFYGIRESYPFYNRTLIEFCVNVPSKEKNKNFTISREPSLLKSSVKVRQGFGL